MCNVVRKEESAHAYSHGVSQVGKGGELTRPGRQRVRTLKEFVMASDLKEDVTKFVTPVD